MKAKYTVLTAWCACVIFSSCKKDFLEVENTEQLFRQSYVKNLASMQEFMNGNYVLLAWYLEHGNGAAYPELVADNLRPLTTTSVMLPHYNWSQVSDGADIQKLVGSGPTARAMDPLWISSYLVIRACSFVVENIAQYRNENPAKADDIRGQALAMRAYLHFKLVNTFAQHYSYTPGASHPGVPYITTADITQPFSRQTVAEVYSRIIEDLKTAIELMPAVATDTRFMNYNAAKALLARVYLFKEDYNNALLLAKDVTQAVPLMTIDNGYPNNLFRLKSPAETESLFQLSPRSNNYFTNFLGQYLRQSTIRYVATADIGLLLTENADDARRVWVTNTGSQWNVTKFPAAAAPEVTPAVSPVETAYYPVIIRSSEMFLTAAEAAARSGDDNTARAFLDSIRMRANPTITPLAATGGALLDSICKERRKELAFESLRMPDLQRWKQPVHRMDFLPGYNSDLPYPSDKAIAPIPVSETRLAGLTPNPGY